MRRVYKHVVISIMLGSMENVRSNYIITQLVSYGDGKFTGCCCC